MLMLDLALSYIDFMTSKNITLSQILVTTRKDGT